MAVERRRSKKFKRIYSVLSLDPVDRLLHSYFIIIIIGIHISKMLEKGFHCGSNHKDNILNESFHV